MLNTSINLIYFKQMHYKYIGNKYMLNYTFKKYVKHKHNNIA